MVFMICALWLSIIGAATENPNWMIASGLFILAGVLDRNKKG